MIKQKRNISLYESKSAFKIEIFWVNFKINDKRAIHFQIPLDILQEKEYY